MMYGEDPSPEVLATVPDNSSSSFTFVANCVFSPIDAAGAKSSWRNVGQLLTHSSCVLTHTDLCVDFALRNGLLTANVTEQHCPNPRGSHLSGFGDLYFTLEGNETGTRMKL